MKARPLVSALLAFLIMLTLFLSAFAETRLSFSSGGEIVGVFPLQDEYFGILGIENNTYTITILDESGHISCINTNIDSYDASYSCFGGSFYFYESLCEAHDAPFYFVSVSEFRFGEDLPRKKVINNAEFRGETPCAFDGNCYYITNVTKLNIYNSRMQPISECRLDSPCSRILARPDGGVYCLCSGNTVYVDEYGDMTELPFHTDELYIAGDKIFANGTFYDKYGHTVCDVHDPSNGAAAFGSTYIGVRNGRLTKVFDGTETEGFEISGDPFITCSTDTAVCFTQNDGFIEAVFFTPDDFKEKSSESPADTTNYPTDRTLIVEQGMTAHRLRTEKYPNAEFTKNGESYSGKLGTGIIMTLGNTDYIIIVKGDITGNGNINNSDLEAAENVLFGKLTLEGAYFTAADMNNDDIIDLKDVYRIYKITLKN